MASKFANSTAGTVAVIGSGVSGMITAYTLLQDGFDVKVLSLDAEPGGVWSTNRIYPGLFLNKYVSISDCFKICLHGPYIVYTENTACLLWTCPLRWNAPTYGSVARI